MLKDGLRSHFKEASKYVALGLLFSLPISAAYAKAIRLDAFIIGCCSGNKVNCANCQTVDCCIVGCTHEPQPWYDLCGRGQCTDHCGSANTDI
jgi:hypothetical protein